MRCGQQSDDATRRRVGCECCRGEDGDDASSSMAKVAEIWEQAGTGERCGSVQGRIGEVGMDCGVWRGRLGRARVGRLEGKGEVG